MTAVPQRPSVSTPDALPVGAVGAWPVQRQTRGFDAAVERDHPSACPDCFVGEPHVCRLLVWTWIEPVYCEAST